MPVRTPDGGLLWRSGEVARGDAVYVEAMPPLPTDCVVQTSHGQVTRMITKVRRELRRGREEMVRGAYRKVFVAITACNDDELYARAQAGDGWRNMCDDIVLLYILRHVLFGYR